MTDTDAGYTALWKETVGEQLIVSNSSNDASSVSMLCSSGMIANACASNMHREGLWYVNRVIVPRYDRGKGIGTILLRRLQEEVVKLGCGRLAVEPGGYGEDPLKQRRFYEKNGFVHDPEQHCWFWIPTP